MNDAEISSLPKDLYDEVTSYVTAIYTKSAEGNEQSLEDFLASNNINMEPDIRSQCRAWLVSSAILEAEGVTEDSQEYKDMMTRILEVYGYKTLDAATGSGIPEAFIRSATASQLAIQIIEKNAALPLHDLRIGCSNLIHKGLHTGTHTAFLISAVNISGRRYIPA